MKASFELLTGRASQPDFFSIEKPLPFSVCSGYRSFSDQLRIWNEKVTGLRPVKDRQGEILINAHLNLSPLELAETITYWSAIPGCSRHHWGTDFDIYDVHALPKNQKLELNNSHYLEGRFSHIPPQMKALESFWYRPYTGQPKGVCDEQWHFSYRPVAEKLASQYTFEIFLKNISDKRILLSEILHENAEFFFERFFQR